MNADGGQQEGDQGEGGQRADLYGARFGFGFHHIAEHAHVADGQLGIGGGDDAAQCGHQGRRRRGGAQDEILGNVPDDVAVGDLPIGNVDLRFALALQAARADFTGHADDGAVGQGEFEVTAERILAGPVAPREGLR